MTSNQRDELLKRAASFLRGFSGAYDEHARAIDEMRGASEREAPFSSGDAIACIAMALQNPPDLEEWGRLLRDARAVIERLENERSQVETQAPIAKVLVREDGPADVMLYSPGLPPGEHDLYCEPPAPGGQKMPHPCFEREPPHCSTCSCGLPVETSAEPPYRLRTFWSPDRKYLVTIHATPDDLTLQDDNGDEWEATGPEQDAHKLAAPDVKAPNCARHGQIVETGCPTCEAALSRLAPPRRDDRPCSDTCGCPRGTCKLY